jgi:hypothetical protein
MNKDTVDCSSSTSDSGHLQSSTRGGNETSNKDNKISTMRKGRGHYHIRSPILV